MTDPLSLEARKRIAEAIPWVKRMKRKRPCTAIKASQLALKHIYPMRGRPVEPIPDHAHCKNEAEWKFTRLSDVIPPYGNRVEYFCWSHLVSSSGIYFSMEETQRFKRWRDRNEKTIEEIARADHS